jgi:hypothetical protein
MLLTRNGRRSLGGAHVNAQSFKVLTSVLRTTSCITVHRWSSGFLLHLLQLFEYCRVLDDPVFRMRLE